MFVEDYHVVLFSIAAFLATIIWSITGYGLAIILLFLYQIFELCGWMDNVNVKYAVFVQSIALLSAFVVLFAFFLKEKKTIYYAFVIPMLIAEVVFTPLGQIVQQDIEVKTLRLIIGVVILLFCLLKLKDYLKCFLRQNKTTEEKPDVFFMVGSQRSGSNWLRTMLDQNEEIAGPHPPHILREFFPILGKYGDLQINENFRRLIQDVCTFIDRNTVPWLDAEDKPIVFCHESIFKSCQKTRTLVSIFEAVMDVYTKANNKKSWVCKSMAYIKYHKELHAHFGSRLKYIYLHRDPRDVAMSFQRAPVGDYHYYYIINKWSGLQRDCIKVMKQTPEIVFKVSYEELLENKALCLQKMFEFMKAARYDINKVVDTAGSKEAKKAASISKQWGNLLRTDQEFISNQSCKWKKEEMPEQDIRMIETICSDVMNYLGYQTVTTGDCIFTDDDLEQFNDLNNQGIARKQKDMEEESPEDLQQRQFQASILKEQFVSNELPSYRCIELLGLLIGSLSGFLAGLVGAKGPPIIIFFLMVYFPKSAIRSTGILLSFASVIVRTIFYVVDDPPEDWPYQNDSWFHKDDWPLYLSVSLTSMTSVFVGLWLKKYVQSNLFNNILLGLLLICGLLMFIKGLVE